MSICLQTLIKSEDKENKNSINPISEPYSLYSFGDIFFDGNLKLIVFALFINSCLFLEMSLFPMWIWKLNSISYLSSEQKLFSLNVLSFLSLLSSSYFYKIFDESSEEKKKINVRKITSICY
jgi:hypothetical protein